jgi:hypothetical protein
MCRIIEAAGLQLPNFEPDAELILTDIRQNFDGQLERPVGAFFVNMCKKHPPEYRESLLGFTLDSFKATTNYYPRVLLLSLTVKLIVLSDFEDADKAARLLAAYPEFVQFHGESMSWKFFEELMNVSGTGDDVPAWATMLVNEAITREEFTRAFSTQRRQGNEFLEKVTGRFEPEQVVELFRRLVGARTPTTWSDWTLVSWMFTRFRDLRAQFLDILPVKQRVTSSDWQIAAAMDVIFEDTRPDPEVAEYGSTWDDGTGIDYLGDPYDAAPSATVTQP